jgi:hypothetical protein
MFAVLRVVQVAKKKKGKKKREGEVLRYSLSAVEALSRMGLFGEEFAKCEADGNVTEVEALNIDSRRRPCFFMEK